MKAVEKQFLKGETIEAKIKFLNNFKQFHSYDEIKILKNELKTENTIIKILI